MLLLGRHACGDLCYTGERTRLECKKAKPRAMSSAMRRPRPVFGTGLPLGRCLRYHPYLLSHNLSSECCASILVPFNFHCSVFALFARAAVSTMCPAWRLWSSSHPPRSNTNRQSL